MTIDQFCGGRGEFYDREEFNGRMVLVLISDIKPDSRYFEQAPSVAEEGTRSWNWITDDTRIPADPNGVQTKSLRERNDHRNAHLQDQTRPAL